MFAWERFPAIARELPSLFETHWREIALNKKSVKLDPNYELFCKYDIAGVLQLLTLRVQGKLVGYAFCMIGEHLHYASTVWCHIDMFYVEREYRRGWIGVRMFREIELRAKYKGAKVLCGVEKLHFKNKRNKPVGKLFRYLGYRPIERVYSKLIG